MTEFSRESPLGTSLLLFNPHDSAFTCSPEAGKLLPLDAQADAWFREARALEDPGIYADDRDYVKIVDLTRQAADRRHWKAMLNLATFYLEGRAPERGARDALQLVEDAMRLGVPAAYDRMGTYYINGTGVQQDATKAYAFWYKAAQLGNPDALAYLAAKMDRAADSDDSWSNIPVATRMLECALAQGFGDAAYDLFFLYVAPRNAQGAIVGDRTGETKARALQTLHQGVKLGCAKCARDLWVEFDHPDDLAWMFVPHIDKARAARYSVLLEALEFNPFRRFPNLDRILPLPPADLPPWDGTRESLLAAAMGVTFAVPAPPADPKPLPSRYFLDPAYRLRKTGEHTAAQRAPFAGYWLPVVADRSADLSGHMAYRQPGLYSKGEPFEALHVPTSDGPRHQTVLNVTWQYLRTVPREQEAVAPQAVSALVREVRAPQSRLHRTSDQRCSVAGIWQPWVPDGHPLQSIVNQPWRQTWLAAGQSFPQPERDWLLDLSAKDVMWHLMENPGEDRVADRDMSDEIKPKLVK
jgi:hypothetical protein